MDDIRIAVFGDRTGINNVFNSLRYPQLVKATFVYGNDLIRDVAGDFLEGWDIIIVAFQESGYAEMLVPMISGYLKDQSTAIIDFYKLRWASRPLMNADVVMNNPYYSSYEGIILGISHSELGILPERLRLGDFANMSVSSQDIYYNNKTLDYCLENYKEKVADLKWAIIDMYDYSYFNYDASMTNKIAFYLGSGGYNKDKHNYDKRVGADGQTFEELVDSIRKIWTLDCNRETMEIWDMLFDTSDLTRLYGDRYVSFNDISRKCAIVSDSQIEEFKLGRYVDKVFEETIEENRRCFKKTLEMLLGINPEINIILTIVPRYAGIWDREENLITNWKDRFYKVLDELKDKYSFRFLDYTRSDFAQNRVFYQDTAHLNFLGAMKFTDMLREDIIRDV